LGGVVSYGNPSKESFLGVRRETLLAGGAVSEETAREMARGARDRFGADLAAAVTGIAGPSGGSEEKPVGTVWFAVADRDGRETAKRRAFVGDRAVVRRAASIHALELVRRHLVGWPPG
jgi:PncC family amidohydrolase